MTKPKIFLKDYNGVLQKVSKRTDEFDFVRDPRDADCLVLWQDVRGELLELCKINKEHLHKPVVVVQHGHAATRDYQFPENFPLYADKFCCWGKHDYERLQKAGYGDRAVITGSPILSYLKPREVHKDRNIVFCPIVAMHEEPANIITFLELKKIELEHSQNIIKKHKEQLRDSWDAAILDPESSGDGTIPYYDINQNWRLISKLTSIHDKNLYFGAATITSVNSATHIEDCVRLLVNADVVVGMVEGTFQLLAMAMDIPVIVCNEWEFKTYGNKDYSKSEMIKTDASVYTDLGGLREAIELELAQPSRLSEQRKRVVGEELGEEKNPDDKIVEVIKGVL